MSNRMKTEYVAKAQDGTSIRYVIWSNGTATKKAALVHSLAMTAEFWESTALALGPDWDVLALDCRGHGASDKPRGPYTVELFADDLASVFNHAKWDKAVVGGASMGGCVTLAFASRHSAKVTGLALIDTTAWYGKTASDDWEERGQKALAGGMMAMTEFQKTRWFSDDFCAKNAVVVDQSIKVFVANDPNAYLKTCRMLGQCNQTDTLSAISVPCEIIVGEEDYAAPVAMAKRMHSAIAGSNLTVIPNARHLTPLEVPETIADIILLLDNA
ncbi:alpha/beta hydrolase [Candidatus Puniceispirillum sp.]|nr:alpha/beta hydrolase [Candidatus Puniceispirillum sp.]